MQNNSKRELTIEVVTDYICPWCYIGKKKLSIASEELKDKYEVKLKFIPFELNPDQPVEGLDRKEYRTKKFGSWEKSVAMDYSVTNAGKIVGVDFNYDNINITPNTLKAHILTAFAAQYNKHVEISEAIFKAYFGDGKDIGNDDVLLNLAEEIGLNNELVKEALQSTDLQKEVRNEENYYQLKGVKSVPFFIVNNVAVSGAQSVEVLKELIRSNAE